MSMHRPRAPDSAEVNRLIALLNGGNLAAAAAAARNLVHTYPRYAKGWHLLGVSLLGQQLLDEATSALRQCTVLDPNDPEPWAHLGQSLRVQGRQREALDAYRKASELRPAMAADWLAAGADCALRLGDWLQAAILASQALDSAPNHPVALSLLAQARLGSGHPHEAIEALNRLVALRPQDPAAHFNLATALHLTHQRDAACASFEQALRLAPDSGRILAEYTRCLFGVGRAADAAARVPRILTRPDVSAELVAELGKAAYLASDYPQAEACYRHALSQQPGNTPWRLRLAYTRLRQGATEEALGEFRRTAEDDPNNALAHGILAQELAEGGHFAEARRHIQRALELDQALPSAWLASAAINEGNLDLDGYIHDLRKALASAPDANSFGALLFRMNYHPTLPAERIYETYREFEDTYARPLYSQWRPHANVRDPARRLRIGYVSPDLREHSARHFIEPLLAHHDPAEVEVFAYAEVPVEDIHSRRFRQHVQHWVSTVGIDHATLAERIRADGIDILVDLAGHTKGNLLAVFARRPAPVAVSWLGYGYTTGLKAIDWFLTDHVTTPEGFEHLFAETPWRLDQCALAYRPDADMGPAASLPALGNGHVTFGSLSRPIRFNDRVIRVWSEILRRVPGSRLELNSRRVVEEAARDTLLARFAREGIGPERLHLRFTSPAAAALNEIDISLDCFPHNSGSTLFESLYMGVPFVTLTDRPPVGRLGASIVTTAGHPEWVANTEAEYIEKTVALASDLGRLAEIRCTLRQEVQTSPLMDEPGFARRVEAAYRAMWQRYCAQGPSA